MKKSRKVRFVNSNMCDDRISLPRHEKALLEMEEDEDNVYMTSIHDRYAARPDCLESMCLAKFAVNYEPLFYSGGVDEQSMACDNSDVDDDGDDGVGHNSIILKNNLGKMCKRKSEAILRIKSFRLNSEPEKYYHSQLILYLPWRSEDQLLGRYDTYKDHYMHVSDIVEHNTQGV